MEELVVENNFVLTEFGIRYIVPNTETVLGTFFQDLGIRYIVPNTVFRY